MEALHQLRARATAGGARPVLEYLPALAVQLIPAAHSASTTTSDATRTKTVAATHPLAGQGRARRDGSPDPHGAGVGLASHPGRRGPGRPFPGASFRVAGSGCLLPSSVLLTADTATSNSLPDTMARSAPARRRDPGLPDPVPAGSAELCDHRDHRDRRPVRGPGSARRDAAAGAARPADPGPRRLVVSLSAGCSCELCQELARFLKDPRQLRKEWPLAQQRRAHIHARIDTAELPVSRTTRRTGRPFSLVLHQGRGHLHHRQDARNEAIIDLR